MNNLYRSARRRRPVKPSTTQQARFQHAEPRLPHERDESSDSQRVANPGAEAITRQGARDLARGLVDTDRGPVLEHLKDEHFGSTAHSGPHKVR